MVASKGLLLERLKKVENKVMFVSNYYNLGYNSKTINCKIK